MAKTKQAMQTTERIGLERLKRQGVKTEANEIHQRALQGVQREVEDFAKQEAMIA